eukprot:gene30419-39197_t
MIQYNRLQRDHDRDRDRDPPHIETNNSDSNSNRTDSSNEISPADYDMLEYRTNQVQARAGVGESGRSLLLDLKKKEIPWADIRTVIRQQEKQRFARLLRPHNIAAINMRVLDLCVLLMSGENTCHHSDHAMTRCLAYGLGVAFRTNQCDCMSFDDISKILNPYKGKGKVASSYSKREFDAAVLSYSAFFPQMCWVRDCDTRVHLICHRHRPVSRTDSNPVRFRTHQMDDLQMQQSMQEE